MYEQKSTDHFLDITREVCPLTFVKTKLLVERMAVGELLDVRLNSGEPLENVPRSLAELGHIIVSLEPEDSEGPGEIYILRIKKR